MENKFKIGDLVRIKSGLTEDETGISIKELKELNGINRIVKTDENDDGYCYLVTNLSLTTHRYSVQPAQKQNLFLPISI